MSEKPIQVFAFECFHKDSPELRQTINAATASKARYDYYLDVSDCWPDVRLIDIRCRKVGGPYTSDGFKRTAAYRGLPDLRCGERVRVGDAEGTIVDHNSSANFDVLFDAGARLNVHPCEFERHRRGAG